MIDDPAILIQWIRGCLWIASICATAFPLLYLFSPWYGSSIGRVVMLHGVAFALVLDFTLLFQYWKPAPLTMLTIDLIVLALVATAAASLTTVLWVTNYKHRKRIKEILNEN